MEGAAPDDWVSGLVEERGTACGTCTMTDFRDHPFE